MKRKLLIGLIILAGGILYLKVISPTFNIHIPCIFKTITGLDCPGCGLTRASLALLDGDLYQAFRYNMLVFIITPLLALYLYLARKKLFPKFNQTLMGSMFILAYKESKTL